MAKVCNERESLTEQFRSALRNYIDAVKALDGISLAEFERFYQVAQDTFAQFAAARARLNYHLASHGCNDPD